MTTLQRHGSATGVTRHLATCLLDLLAVGAVYFVLAKIGLTLASINSSTSAIWPATGFALAAVLMWGYRVAPAILIASFAANVTNSESIYAATGIAFGNTLEALVAAWLINLWCDGRATFATTTGVAKFALVCVSSTMISATVGIASLIFSGDAPTAFAMTWMTWWLGDLAGALVIAPFVILWAGGDLHSFAATQRGEVGTIAAATIAVGIIAFSPLFDQTSYRDPLGFLALPPLLWAALRRDPRETATVVVILCCFAVWGTLAGSGPFARVSLNDSFLLLVMFFISISVPSMALSADVQMRRRSEEQLQHAHDELAARAGELRDTAARLQVSSGKLEERVEQRTHELKSSSSRLHSPRCSRRSAAPASIFISCSIGWLTWLPGFARLTVQASGAHRARPIKSRRHSAIGRSTGKDWIGFLSVRDRTPAWAAHCWSNRLFMSSMGRMILSCTTRSRLADIAR